jgi:rRNA maturation protein Nop10/uncharacterized protein YndB with AHSA1/START domain
MTMQKIKHEHEHHEVLYLKGDHDHRVVYTWENPEVQEEPGGNLLLFLDVDAPFHSVLLNRPDWDIQVGGYRIGSQDWKVEQLQDPDGRVTQVALTYTGKEPRQRRQYKEVRRVVIKIDAPRSPGRFYKTEPGLANVTLVPDCLREEPPDEMECPKCEAELYPVPETCPLCGADLNEEVPTVGELADRYGRDATVGVSIRSMSADLMLTYTRTKAQADEANKEARAIHDEKVATHKAQKAAWATLIEPFKQKQKVDREARERAELERLKAKFPEAEA